MCNACLHQRIVTKHNWCLHGEYWRLHGEWIWIFGQFTLKVLLLENLVHLGVIYFNQDENSKDYLKCCNFSLSPLPFAYPLDCCCNHGNYWDCNDGVCRWFPWWFNLGRGAGCWICLDISIVQGNCTKVDPPKDGWIALIIYLVS